MKQEESAFVKILETDSITDIALIRSVLDGSGVTYFIQGENMKHIRNLDPAVLMVAPKDVKKVLKLLEPLTLNHVRLVP